MNRSMSVRTHDGSETDGGAGSAVLVVTDLPQAVVSDSLFAEGTANVEVRAVRYRQRAVGEEPREEVRKLDEQIETLSDAITLNQRQQELVAKRLAYLDKLENFVAPTAEAELSKGVLNAETLKAVTEFSFEQRETAAERQIKLGQEARDLERQRSLVQRKRAELTGKSSRTAHEAVVFIDRKVKGKQTLRLTYLVNNCGWAPAYNFRAEQNAGRVRVEYNGVITQMSGEDWDGVKLTLSTASPALSAAGPGIAPFQVTLTSGVNPNRKQSAAQVAGQLKDISRDQYSQIVGNNAAISQKRQLDTAWSLNTAANDLQLLELTCPPHALGTIVAEGPTDGQQPSLSYGLEGPVSLASRGDQQMIRIMQSDLNTKFYYVATPVLTTQVFREATLTNATNTDLLAGPASVYLDGRFVGRTEIMTVARGQTFIVGFGADPQLRASRELIERKESTQGGNQVLSVKIRLAIDNYKDADVPVRLQDRIPYLGMSEDVRISLDELQTPLSDDPVYLRLDRPKGILRWEIVAPGGGSGASAEIVNFGYKLEFDRNYDLANPTGKLRELQEEFNELQEQRLRF